MAILDAKLPAFQASTKAISTTKAEAKLLEGKGPLTVDGGGGLPLTTRLLLKNQVTASQNGLWEVATYEAFACSGSFAGSGKFAVGSEWVLTRTADADSSGEVTEGMLVPVEEGTTNRKTSWIQRTPGPIEVGVTAQTFESLAAGALGAAGGDLTGSYSEPSIAEAVIDNSKVKASAGIKASKLDLKEQVASTDLATTAKQLFPQLPMSGTKKIASGTVSVTFTAGTISAIKTVTHELGTTPSSVVLAQQGTELGLLFARSQGLSSTTFEAVGASPFGSVTGTAAFGWIAFG
jgi:hypothetical protein